MVAVRKAVHRGGYLMELTFDTGESAVVDLLPTLRRYPKALTLLNESEFGKFRLDDWPTIVWDCGFDLSPECLYELATGKSPSWQRARMAVNS